MAELLRIENLSAGYADAVVLNEIGLTLDEGKVLAVLGRNGMGKTTLIATLMGATQIHGGRISFRGSGASVLSSLLNYVTVLPITLEIAILSPELGLPHGDQFDRIITATAKVHRLPLITRDAAITDSGLVATIW